MKHKIRVRRTMAVLLSTLGVAMSVGIAAAPAAHAAPTACPAGYACVYRDNGDFNLSPTYKSAGNASPNIQMTTPDGGFVWNNGRPCTNCDQLYVIMRYVDGRRYAFCLSNGPVRLLDGDTDVPTLAQIAQNETVLSWRWQGRCAVNLYREGVFL